MIELLLPCGFDTLEYSWVKAIIDIYTPVDYSMAKKCQQHSTKEDVIANKRTTLSNLKLPRAPTTMEGLGNCKREPRRLQKRPEHGGRIQSTSTNQLP
jgi:hypothetical protein